MTFRFPSLSLLIFGAVLLVSCGSGDQKLPKDLGLQIDELVGISDWDFEESSFGDNCSFGGSFTYNVTAKQPVTGVISGEILYNNGSTSGIAGFVIDGEGLLNSYVSGYSENACNYRSSSQIKIESVWYLYV
ncbi:MAG: hypothetical protein F4226_06090 [Synechococcus sp. SB0678_bin_12]|nr:hypothetical protein [Cyanobacteria bacterium MAG IRC3_bin_20]MYF36356.1 hypothetical protein [Synechococcus sp. SB0678_bin_12]